MGLILISSIEYLLKQITVRHKSHACPVGDGSRQVEQSVTVVMFRDLHKVLCTSIREEIDPFFRIENRGCEILDEIVVDHVRSVGVEVVLPGMV